jgi:membrane-associated phospholipid phosphatase
VSALLGALLLAAAQTDNQLSPPAPVLLIPPAGVAAVPNLRPREVYKLHLAVDVPVTIAAGSMALVRIFFENHLARRTCPCSPAGINRLDRGTVGDHSAVASIAANATVYGTLAALPLFDLVDLEIGRTLGEDLVVYAETIAIDTALQNVVNFIVSRPRPRTYAGDPAFVTSGEGYLSFYAGHVSTTFAAVSAAAVTIRKRYGEQVWPWLVAGLIGTSVAVERVASGHHFPTDVGVAALVGTAIGITIPWLHFRREKTDVQITPLGTQALGVAGSF